MRTLVEELTARGLLDPALAAEARAAVGDDPVALTLWLQRRGVPVAGLEEALRALAPAASPPGLPPPEQLAPYRPVREVARGGMGVVYEVEDAQTGARLALKTLLPTVDPEEQERFVREAQVAAAVQHPRVVRVHAARFDTQPPFLVQDLLTGGDLQQRVVSGGPLDEGAARALAAKLADGLAALEAAGVLHRDLKPANVLFDERDEPAIADFGLGHRQADRGLRLTHTGELLGTPAYMAPEQVSDPRAVTPAADVYALGGVLFFALTGRAPFQAGSLWATLDQVLHAPPPDPRALGVELSDDLRRLLEVTLAKDPAARPDARSLADWLRRPREAPRRRGWQVGAVALALLGVLLLAVVAARGPGATAATSEPPPVVESPSRAPVPPKQAGPASTILDRLETAEDPLQRGVLALRALDAGAPLRGPLLTALRRMASEGAPFLEQDKSRPGLAFTEQAGRWLVVSGHDGRKTRPGIGLWDLERPRTPLWFWPWEGRPYLLARAGFLVTLGGLRRGARRLTWGRLDLGHWPQRLHPARKDLRRGRAWAWAVSPSGRRLAVVDRDGAVRLLAFDPPQVRPLPLRREAYEDLRWLDEQTLLIALPTAGGVELETWTDQGALGDRVSFEGGPQTLSAISIAADRRRILVSAHGKVQLFNRKLQLQTELKTPADRRRLPYLETPRGYFAGDGQAVVITRGRDARQVHRTQVDRWDLAQWPPQHRWARVVSAPLRPASRHLGAGGRLALTGLEDLKDRFSTRVLYVGDLPEE